MFERLDRVQHLRESIDTGLTDEALDIIEAVLDGHYRQNEYGHCFKKFQVMVKGEDYPQDCVKPSADVNKCVGHSEQVHSAPCLSVDVQSECTIAPCAECGGSGIRGWAGGFGHEHIVCPTCLGTGEAQ